jgi:CPA1 family monovalent cation:H+ antiporter
MEHQSLVPHIIAIMALFFIAAISSIALRRIKIPYTIGLVVVGVLIAYIAKDVEALDIVRDIRLSHDVILYVLLPTLIFEASISINSKLLFKNLIPILLFAIPGLLVSTLIVGTIMSIFTPLHLGTAILFGALISATDPVSVVSLFKEIGAPKRLTILVDGESLFNDAAAIVLFNIIAVGIVSQLTFDMENVLYGTLYFLKVFFGGIAIGAIIGYVISWIISNSRNEPATNIALSTVLAYTSFITAEYFFEVSGVMAVLASGMLLSWQKLTQETEQQLHYFWEYAAFVCNSFIFLLLGVAELQLILMIGEKDNILLYMVIAVLAVTIARMFVVFVMPHVMPFRFTKINTRYKTIIFWGGLRGAVPLALVLSLSRNFESHQLLVELTLGVVLFTLLVQGPTIKPLMRALGIKAEK